LSLARRWSVESTQETKPPKTSRNPNQSREKNQETERGRENCKNIKITLSKPPKNRENPFKVAKNIKKTGGRENQRGAASA
jgi:hypothetical protein